MGRHAPEQQLEQLLVMIPWIMRQDGPTVDEVCKRFAISEVELARSLELLFLCGLYPFTPDALIEADIIDDRVYIRSADQFAAPPRLLAQEAVGLLAAAQAAQARRSADDRDQTLASAIVKLTAALGVSETTAEVELDRDVDERIPQLADAIDNRRVISVSYYSHGRNVISKRELCPLRLFEADAKHYLLAARYEHSAAQGQSSSLLRTLRVDRILAFSTTGNSFEPIDVDDDVAFLGGDAPTVRLRLDASARWAAEQYPTEEVIRRSDGTLEVVLRVTEPNWLARLLLRLGRAATIIEGECDVATPGSAILARYR